MQLLQTLGPSILVIIGGIISWIIRSYIDELKLIKEKLRSERRKIYMDLILPYIKILSDPKGQGMSEALKQITSFDYKKTAFELSLIGSDEVLNAFHAINKKALEREITGQKNPKEDLFLWGKLFLEIRKSLGNRKTNLKEFDMLRGFVKDIDDYID